MDIGRRAFLGSLLAAVLVASCGSGASPLPGAVPTPTPTASPTATPVTVTDFQGRSVTIAAPPRRIVSIGASNTEFLFALGAGDRVVGVDDFSDEPAAAREKEKVGGVQVNVERVVALRPDLVVTVLFSDGTIEKLAETTTVLVVDPQGLADVAETAILLGRAVGADGERLAADIAAQLEAVRSRTAGLSPKPRVFHEVDASDPAKPFTVGPGSFIHELIEIAGGVNVAAGAGSPYPQLSAEELVRSDPEVIVLGDADYGVTPEQVAARPGWGGIMAVRTGRIHPISGSLVSRPGPRVGEAAEAYARLLHPEAFR
ncbi:MAG: ABC transporter substrate-binding protein [Solirubrobacteraceae bacterium]